MRILLVANKFPYPAKDGGSIATLSLAKSLALLGHDVTMLALNTSKHYTDPDTVPSGLAAAIRFISVPADTGIKFTKMIRNFLFSRLPYNAERFICKAFEQTLAKLLKEEVFDIIQLEGLYLAPYLDVIRASSRAKVVMRAHNIEHEIWERTVSQQSGIRKIYLHNLAGRIKKMELHYMNLCDAVLPITPRDGEILKQLGCRIPSHVVPMGVNAADLLPDHSHLEFPSLFHIGALDWMPNQEGLLWFFENVWGKILEKHPGLRFYLAGRNAPPKFTSLAYPNIEFLGEVDDAYQFIRSKSIMIVPILSGSGMRIKIIEGMALGKAIVTTPIGTEGIATTHGENIFIAGNPGDFAAYICNLVENRELCLQTGENARNFVVDHFDNNAITVSLLAFYKNLLQ